MDTVLRSRTKDMSITIVIKPHLTPPDRRWGWGVGDVMPGRDGPETLCQVVSGGRQRQILGPENLRILKKSQLGVEIGPWS